MAGAKWRPAHTSRGAQSKERVKDSPGNGRSSKQRAYAPLFFQAFQIFPEGLVLLDEGFLGEGEFEAENKIRQGMVMQDVVGEEDVASDLEIEAEIAGAKAIKGFAVAEEAAHVLGAAGEILGVDFADFLHQIKLDGLGEFLQLRNGLVAEIQLVHGGEYGGTTKGF